MTITATMPAEQPDTGGPWAVIRLVGDGPRTIRDVLILFGSRQDADLAATELGLSEYGLCPIRFVFDDCRPAVGAGSSLVRIGEF